MTRTASVDSLEVHGASGIAIGFCSDYHPALPPHWGVDRDPFNYPESDVSVQAIEDSLLPVQGHCPRGVYSSRGGSGVDVKFQGRATLEVRERLVLAYIERGCCVSVKQELLQLRYIGLCGRAWHDHWR